MGVVAITSVFLGIRKDRDPEYYLRPLRDFVTTIRSSTMEVRVYTQPENVRLVRRYAGDVVFPALPERLLLKIWPDPKWRDRYSEVIARNPTHCNSVQARYPQLICVYLGKIALLELAFRTGVDVVWWFDAGHWVSHLCSHDLSTYTQELVEKVDPRHMATVLHETANSVGCVGTRAPDTKSRFHMPLEFMDQYAHELNYRDRQPLPLYQGVFWLVHRDSADSFLTGVRSWWLRLINDGKAGTEENALTLLGWQKGYRCLHYTEWVEVLCGKAMSPGSWDAPRRIRASGGMTTWHS